MRQPTITNRLQRGFTLLELLVVMFVMLLMAGLAVASIRQFLETERIRLAGGTVDSAIRLARQYAMSKRTQCMVEFVDPVEAASLSTPTLENGGFETPSVGPVGVFGSFGTSGGGWSGYGMAANGSGYTNTNPNAPEGIQVGLLQKTGTLTQSVPGFMDGAGYTISFKAAKRGWASPAGAANDFNVVLDGVVLGTYTPNSTSYVAYTTPEQKPGAGTKVLQFVGLNSANHSDVTAFIDDVSITQTTAPPPPPPGGAADTVPRAVRIIPYRRWLNRSTGGFTWLLEQDVNALKTMELPKNIHFALKPGRASVAQYDPADLIDKSSNISKVFLVLAPDGTCSGVAPSAIDEPVGTRDHWKTYTNTVILRDLANDDLCLMYTSPATAFTRERYLFGGAEVDEFVAAHAPYVLW